MKNSNIVLFSFESKEIRVVMGSDGEPWFVAKDVAKILGYSDTVDAVTRHCRWAVKHLVPHPQSNDKQIEVQIIPERDVYRLVMRSKLPSAERFEEWVVGEVLPSIRKTGTYSIQQNIPDFTNPAEAARAWADQYENRLLAENKVKEQKEVLKLQEPKVEFYDAVTESKDAVDMGEAAKVLNLGIGRTRLFQFLRDQKILMRDNIPYQKFVDFGYFRVIKTKFNLPNGDIKINLKTLVFQKGLDFIVKLYKSKNTNYLKNIED